MQVPTQYVVGSRDIVSVVTSAGDRGEQQGTYSAYIMVCIAREAR
jgi:hypothetical protein